MNKKSIKNQNKLTSYYHFLRIITLSMLICYAKEPVINLLTISGDYRKYKTEDWIFYAYKNKQMYESQIMKKKILIVSGSNALFGMDAKQIESSTGVPTVNLGVHAGLGIDYILYQAKKTLKPGDIVLLPLEFSLYHQSKDDQLLSNTLLRKYIISYDHDYLSQLGLIEKLKVILYPSGISQEDIDAIAAILKNESPFDKNRVYSRILERVHTGKCYTGISLNRNGDETCNIGKSPTEDIKNKKLIDPVLNKPIDTSGSIRDFCIYAKKHKITVIPLYPALLFNLNYDSNNYKIYFSQIKTFWLEQGFLFQDSPSQSFLEEKMMFNTIYHPNDKGRTLRTENVINLLKNHLSEPNVGKF